MGDIVMHNVVSVDGFIADENDEIGPLFDWYFNGETPLTDGSNFRVSEASAAYVARSGKVSGPWSLDAISSTS